MKDLELGESNEWLSFINKEGGQWIHLPNTAGVARCPHVHTGPHSSSLYRMEIHPPSTWEQVSQWSPMFAFTVEAELTYQMVTQNVFYYHRESATEDLDGFMCLFWLWHFPRTQPWES